ncbi:hypothetical protein AN476_18750 [Phaeobacter sp. 11ANDIMAR09]|nr:hypothetical protein AN476_18750 [Phaeobacter sp. 11ANDIMAR09]
MRLGHYPSDTADGSLGAFDISCPLTAPMGPGSVPFWAGRGRKIRLPWATLGEFLDDLIGGLCVCLLLFLLLFLEFLK